MSKLASVANSMTRDVVFLRPSDSLQLAHRLMTSEGYRHVPIVEEGRLVAMLSDRDILLLATPGAKGGVHVPDLPITEAMTRHPVTCSERTTISDAAAVMIRKKIDSLPVVDSHRKLVGLITATDLLRLLQDDDSGYGATVIPLDFNMIHYQEYAAAASAR